MSHQRLSTPEASKALGIPVHVISYWLGQIPYPAEQDENGQWRLTPEALGVLQTVKDLKERNHSMETIRRMVRELVDSPPPPPSAPPSGRPAASPQADPTANAQRAVEEQAAEAAARPPRIATPSGRTVDAPDPTVAPRKAEPGAKPGPRKAAPRAGEKPKPLAPAAPPAVPAAPVPGGDAGAIAAYVARAVADAVRQETVLSHRYAHAAHQIGKLEAENEHLRAMLTSSQRRHQRELDDTRQRLVELEQHPEVERRTPWWAWFTMLTLLGTVAVLGLLVIL
ncbi:MAG: helix-turn-helix domain-containing protein [Candidatus Sericytochromatia bacterium]|nr:helix-turn-helix domain-containing protein [Candidatus Sericytochromatia bacterium]